LNELVERIAVHAPIKNDVKRTVEIDIYFSLVGLVGKLELPETGEFRKVMKSNDNTQAMQNLSLSEYPLS
jgi:hypothetical protein